MTPPGSLAKTWALGTRLVSAVPARLGLSWRSVWLLPCALARPRSAPGPLLRSRPRPGFPCRPRGAPLGALVRLSGCPPWLVLAPSGCSARSAVFRSAGVLVCASGALPSGPLLACLPGVPPLQTDTESPQGGRAAARGRGLYHPPGQPSRPKQAGPRPRP